MEVQFLPQHKKYITRLLVEGERVASGGASERRKEIINRGKWSCPPSSSPPRSKVGDEDKTS